MNFKRILALFKARNLEYYRDRAAFAWNFIMPVIMIMGFAFSFNYNEQTKYKVAIINYEKLEAFSLDFTQTKYVQYLKNTTREDALDKVADHRIDMLIDANTQEYFINPTSSNGYVLEKFFSNSDQEKFKRKEVEGELIRYVDWVIPGVLAMNIMWSALWGIGFVIVRYRKNGVLKRLKGTPATAVEFLLSQLFSRVWVMLITTVVVYFALDFILNFKMQGSHFLLFFILTLGCICLISLGLLVASRLKNEELASGLLNLFGWPMMMLSNVWFSLEGAHPILQKLALLFPLTHITNASRKIMLDGATFFDLLPEMSFLIIFSVLFLIIGSLLFKWE